MSVMFVPGSPRERMGRGTHVSNVRPRHSSGENGERDPSQQCSYQALQPSNASENTSTRTIDVKVMGNQPVHTGITVTEVVSTEPTVENN